MTVRGASFEAAGEQAAGADRDRRRPRADPGLSSWVEDKVATLATGRS